MRSICLSIVLVCIVILPSSAQESKKELKAKKKEAQYQNVIDLIQSEKYEFIGEKANPQGGRQIDLTTRPNFLRVISGNAMADMPYFGRAFSGGYSNSDGGVNFDGKMQDYELQKNDAKKRVEVKFKVKGTSDTYTCSFTISSLENASLSVMSNKKQSIYYTGRIGPLKEKE